MGAFLFWGRYLYIITHIKYLKKLRQYEIPKEI